MGAVIAVGQDVTAQRHVPGPLHHRRINGAHHFVGCVNMVFVLQSYQDCQGDQSGCHQRDSIYMGQPVASNLLLVVRLPLLPLLSLLSETPDICHSESSHVH